MTNLLTLKTRYLCHCLYHRRHPSHNFPLWLAASYTRTSTDSVSTLLSACLQISSDLNRLGLDSFSLINLQSSLDARNKTGQNHRQNPGPARAAAGINPLVCTWLWWLWLAMLAEFVKHFWNKLLTVSLQSKQMRRCTPLNQAAAMLKLSGQSDPDPQRYLRLTHTHTHTHTHRNW